MATIFTEGFDRYGTAGMVTPAVATAIGYGGWSVFTNTGGVALAGSLNGQGGSALTVSGIAQGGNTATYATKTLPQNYSRLIGGVRISTDLVGANGIAFSDGTTVQCMVLVMPTSGRIAIYSSRGGTQLQLGTASIASGVEHYLEYDITFGPASGIGAGSWTVWLDGVQCLAGNGATETSGNNYANVVQLSIGTVGGNVSTSVTFDDVYVFDDTTSYNNSALLSNPLVYTQVAISDKQTQFTNNGNIVGNTAGASGAPNILGNYLLLMPITPIEGCTLGSITFVTTGGSSNACKGVLYADSSGSPGSLLATGTEISTFPTPGTATLPMPSTSLTANTQYWIGLIIDASYFNPQYAPSGGAELYSASNTYSSGPPSTAPTMSPTGYCIYMSATCSGAAGNSASLVNIPPPGAASSVQASSSGTEDLYQFPNLPTSIQNVYTVAVSAYAQLEGSGTTKFDLLAKSGSTTGEGSNTAIAPTATFAWYDSNFDTDPNTSAAWTPGDVNIAYYGMKIN